MTAREVEQIVSFYIRESDCPDMRSYGQGFLDHYARGLHSVKQAMRLGQMRRSHVFDLGCGFGWHALIISLSGDDTVVANDIRPLMVEQIEKRLSAVRDKFGIVPAVRTLLGDFITADIPDSHFDAIFCCQTIEHIHDLAACFQKAYAVLKSGGRLVIMNDNNRLTRKHLRGVEDMWNKRDTSWDYIEELKRLRPEENRGIEPYAVMRSRIIEEADASLSPGDLRRITDATAGMTRPEILAAVRRFSAGAGLPARPAFSWCRNPETGEYCERQLDPFVLKDQLRSVGFRVRLLQDLRRGGPLRLFTRMDVPLLNRLLFGFRSRFVLAARKP